MKKISFYDIKRTKTRIEFTVKTEIGSTEELLRKMKV